MNEINELNLKQRFEAIKTDMAKECPVFAERLQEKGVEIALLIPLFEIIMGFNPLTDIRYELTSDKQFERFDFLLDDKLIVEAKRLNTLLDKRIIKQLEEYISHHSNINYGIISNGIQYAFLVKCSFIKEFLGPEESLKIDISKDTIHVMTLSVYDEPFFSIMKLFSKTSYHEMFKLIAKYSLTRINQTRATKIVDDKELNSWLQEKISDCIDIRHGAFLKDIQEGRIKIGQLLQFDNGLVQIKVEVLNDGRVKLIRGSSVVLNLNQVMTSEFKPMIELVMGPWNKEDFIFNGTDEIIKVATGRERLFRNVTYEFKIIL